MKRVHIKLFDGNEVNIPADEICEIDGYIEVYKSMKLSGIFAKCDVERAYIYECRENK